MNIRIESLFNLISNSSRLLCYFLDCNWFRGGLLSFPWRKSTSVFGILCRIRTCFGLFYSLCRWRRGLFCRGTWLWLYRCWCGLFWWGTWCCLYRWRRSLFCQGTWFWLSRRWQRRGLFFSGLLRFRFFKLNCLFLRSCFCSSTWWYRSLLGRQIVRKFLLYKRIQTRTFCFFFR